MIIEIASPPRTIMEVYKMLPEGTLAELVNGQLYMSPAPTNLHQRTSRKIAIQLSQFIDEHTLGEIFYAPSDVYLDEEANAVQPDLYFISKGNDNQPLDEIPYQSVPDLIIEILSPSNNKHDLITKKNLYEKFGVKEYWIVDPTTKETLLYELIKNQFVLKAQPTAKVFSTLLNHLFSF
jgi:Uma2 family endonuclease